MVIHLFFERVLVVHVNFGDGSGSIAVLEFWDGDIICAIHNVLLLQVIPLLFLSRARVDWIRVCRIYLCV